MLTLRDIDTLTKSHDGSIYSDLYKEVYGCRPYNPTFETVEAFDADFEYLSLKLDKQIVYEQDQQLKAFAKFAERVAEAQIVLTQAYGEPCERETAILQIAHEEGIRDSDIDFYGNEIIENELNLKYGSIKKWLEE
jgi:hypothetical protein